MKETTKNDSRWYPEQPMAGVGVVVLREGEVLLIRRGQEPGKGKWSIPGGGIELGETVFEAARREVMEECSIEVEIERSFNTADAILRDEEGRVKYHFVLTDVLARYRSGEIRARSDAEECRWFKASELAGLDMPAHLPGVLRKVLEF